MSATTRVLIVVCYYKCLLLVCKPTCPLFVGSYLIHTQNVMEQERASQTSKMGKCGAILKWEYVKSHCHHCHFSSAKVDLSPCMETLAIVYKHLVDNLDLLWNLWGDNNLRSNPPFTNISQTRCLCDQHPGEETYMAQHCLPSI